MISGSVYDPSSELSVGILNLRSIAASIRYLAFFGEGSVTPGDLSFDEEGTLFFPELPESKRFLFWLRAFLSLRGNFEPVLYWEYLLYAYLLVTLGFLYARPEANFLSLD